MYVEKFEEIAREQGFDLVGVAPANSPQDLEHFDRWLQQGMHGEMEYLKRHRDRIAKPNSILPRAKSILCLGLSHARDPQQLPEGGKVARYALGRDYHNLIGRMLKRLIKALKQAGLARNARSLVDAGPLLERSHAAEAGLGFRSKSGNLLHPKIGPWFFLAELVLDSELAPTPAKSLPNCGSCTACIDACPTKAISPAFVVDARKCISYLTIEHRSAIPQQLRSSMQDWVFGCDVCSEVCPFGSKAQNTESRYGTHESIRRFRLVDLLELGPHEFSHVFQASPLKRPKRAGLQRNALIALANSKNESALPQIQKKMQDPDPLLRAHAAWALGQLGDKKSLATAKKIETNSQVQLEIQNAFEEN